MNQQTQGIVLKQIKYGESSRIVKIYTKDFGLQSYLIKSIKNKRNKDRYAGILQPLSQIDLTAFSYKKQSLNIFKEGKAYKLFHELHTHPVKILMAFFLSDLLTFTLKEEHPDRILFNFMSQSIELLDKIERSYSNFHLWFMLQLTHFLGFFPFFNKQNAQDRFDLLEGKCVTIKSIYTCTLQETELIKTFTTKDFEKVMSLKINRSDRQKTLAIFLKYYHLHNYNILNLKSLKVLKEVLQ